MDLEERLNKLRELYPDEESIGWIHDMEKRMRPAVLTSQLKNNDAMKLIIGKYQKEIGLIDRRLTTDKLLFSEEKGKFTGLLLHERKDWINSFLKLFDAAESQVKSINSTIDAKLLNDNE